MVIDPFSHFLSYSTDKCKNHTLLLLDCFCVPSQVKIWIVSFLIAWYYLKPPQKMWKAGLLWNLKQAYVSSAHPLDRGIRT